jgi:uncharacterized protein
MVESAVGAHLLNASKGKRFNLYYWNTNYNELDFVMEKNGKLAGIEVKSGSDSRSNGMALFGETFHPDHLFIVGTGGIPVDKFLAADPSELFDI